MTDWAAIPELLAGRVQCAPESTAILAPGRAPLRYTRLLRLAEDTVARLNAAGVGRGDRVAIVLPNGPELATAFVSVAAGAVCAPLNPAYGRKEFEFFLSDLQPKALILQSGMASAAREVAQDLNIPVMELGPGDEAAGGFSLTGGADGTAAAPRFSGPDDVALVLHTSGTTARPKIVPLTHANLCASARNIRGSLALTEGDRCLNVMPLFHIHGLIGAVLSTLSAGASVVCTPGFLAPRFFEWMDEFAPTWYTAVPTMHQAILERAAANREVIARHPLRLIRSCSAALPPRVMADLEAAFSAPAIESYGMTEASHQMASNPLPPAPRKPGSVGVPAGPEIAIMDEAGNLLPRDATGEVVIRGQNVTLGYEGNPKANQSAFTNGWFRTGDQGHLDADGYLFLTGRLKEVINRGGEKISPREIDEVLLNHPAVKQAVVFAVPHARLGEEIGAVVVLEEGASITETEIREFAAARLADFKVPSVVRIAVEIPKGPTGKMQRIGLAEKLGIPPIGDGRESERTEFVEPRTPLEEKLAELWRETLRVTKAGVHDDFFLLGGDSMLATQLLARICQEVGAGLTFVGFLEAPTIAGMALRLEEAKQGEGTLSRGGCVIVPIRPGGGKPPLFYMPGHDGNLISGFHLAKYLDPDQPVFGLLPLVEGERPVWRIEELAERFLAAVRARQAEGPYYLAGHCFGGYLAYEMARRLEQAGQRVGLLALIDAYCWRGMRSAGILETTARKLRHLAVRTRMQSRILAGRRGKDRLPHVLDRVRAFLRHWTQLLREREYGFRISRGLPLPPSLRQRRYVNNHAGKHYEPQSYPGSAVLFRVLDRRPDTPWLGWRGLIQGELEMHDAPYHHLGIADEQTAAITGAQLRECLERAQAGVEAGSVTP